MTLVELLFLSVGLAMDAFAVAICKGISIKNDVINKSFKVGLWFGFFQAIMPFFGYFIGLTFNNFLVKINYWIVFFLLLYLGSGMIRDAFFDDEIISNNTDFGEMFLLSIATSVDAFAIGITFSILKVNIILAISFIGIITFVLSSIGVLIGKTFGDRFHTKAEVFGGIILILLGVKVLLEHLNIF